MLAIVRILAEKYAILSLLYQYVMVLPREFHDISLLYHFIRIEKWWMSTRVTLDR